MGGLRRWASLLAVCALAVARSAAAAPAFGSPAGCGLHQFVNAPDASTPAASRGASAARFATSTDSAAGGSSTAAAAASPTGYTLTTTLTFAGYDANSLGTLQQFALARALAAVLGLTSESQLQVFAPAAAAADDLFVAAAVGQANALLPSDQTIWCLAQRRRRRHPQRRQRRRRRSRRRSRRSRVAKCPLAATCCCIPASIPARRRRLSRP